MAGISGKFDASNETRINKVFQAFGQRPVIGKWVEFRCPFCDDREKKVVMRLFDDGTIGISSKKCGCSKEAILNAKGLNLYDLNPNKSAGKDGSARAQVVIGSFENVNAHIERPWLWPSYIAHGEVTILYGEEGEGKSLITCNLAAALSTVTAGWPGHEPRNLGTP